MTPEHQKLIFEFLNKLDDFKSTQPHSVIKCKNRTRIVCKVEDIPDRSERYVYYMQDLMPIALDIEDWMLEEWRLVK